ncbi:hypothetical protein BGX28_003566 [Mortierella sp. GBA30]|nr:hypothetical protein BGX28_003566 [Mortierella sp. GBA30]
MCAWVHLVRHTEEFPLINVIAADPGSDSYYRPTVLDRFPVSNYRFVDETIFLYGRDPTHRPSWTLNSLLSLHSVMNSYGGSPSSWFMRVMGENKDTDTDRNKQYRYRQGLDQDLDTFLLAPYGREIVFDQQRDSPLSNHKISPPSKAIPTCFAKAVIGLQSRCTRPYCENLVGGSELVESLRTKALDALSPSMARFQLTDPNIVHPNTDDAPKVSEHNTTVLEGENAPRSRIHVALLGRYGNTSIPNANALELSLLARGFSAKTIHLDYPAEIGLAQAAQLFKDQSILVAPQGDALGYSTWMVPGTVVISVLPRFTRSSKVYTDRMMAFGKRFFAWDCQDESCVQPDRDLAHECIEAVQASYEDVQGISAFEFEEFANMKQDFRQRSVAWKAIANCYTKEVSRRINVAELTILIESLAKDFTLAPMGVNEHQPEGDYHARRAWTRRGVESEDAEDQGLEESATAPEESNEEDGSTESDAEDSDQDKEADVRIQDEKEGEDEDINVHEYDEQTKSISSSSSSASSEDKEAQKQDTTITLASPPQSPPPPSLPTLPMTLKTAANSDVQSQSMRPIVGFAEFCKRGRCCGSSTVRESEFSGSLGGRALTPCAASMSTIVFGKNGLWGQADEAISVQASQDLVWQVDLGRHSRA